MDDWNAALGEAWPKRQKIEDGSFDGSPPVPVPVPSMAGFDLSQNGKGNVKGQDSFTISFDGSPPADLSQNGKGNIKGKDSFSMDSWAGESWSNGKDGKGKGMAWPAQEQPWQKGDSCWPQSCKGKMKGDSWDGMSKGLSWDGFIGKGDSWDGAKGKGDSCFGKGKGDSWAMPTWSPPGDNWCKGDSFFKGDGWPKGDGKGKGKVIPPLLPLQESPDGVRKKTKICQEFINNGGISCPRGKCCTYAHGEHELGQVIPAELVFNLVNKVKVKLKLCNSFSLTGNCFKGDLCTFAHGEGEVGTPQPVLSNDQKVAIQQAAMQTPPKFQGNFKTRLCMHYPNGNCSRGPQCAFAHGEAEIGTPTPWYQEQMRNAQAEQSKVPVKTEICSEFFDGGVCPRGATCPFIHGEEEIGTPQPLLALPAPPGGGMPMPGGMPGSMPGGMPGSMPGSMPQVGGMGPKPGDWRCMTCGDLVFAKKTVCSMCGTPAPAGNLMQQQLPAGSTTGSLQLPGIGNSQVGQMGAPMGNPGQFGSMAAIANAPAAGQPPQPEDEYTKMMRFKTSLCQEFIMTGNCPRGATCQMAHGQAELMQPGEALRMMQQRTQVQAQAASPPAAETTTPPTTSPPGLGTAL